MALTQQQTIHMVLQNCPNAYCVQPAAAVNDNGPLFDHVYRVWCCSINVVAVVIVVIAIMMEYTVVWHS